MADSRICAIEGCGKAHYGKGWCSAHYQRWWKYGDPLGGAKSRTANGLPLAFLENTVIPFDGDDCLPWPYGKDRKGYGVIYIGGKKRYVSRIACEAEHGPPPTPKHEAAHLCGKGHEGCCNRRHLEWKTTKENAADRLLHGTQSRGERCGAAKLTEAQVLEIRAAIGTNAAIAITFGVSRRAIGLIRSGARWRHI